MSRRNLHYDDPKASLIPLMNIMTSRVNIFSSGRQWVLCLLLYLARVNCRPRAVAELMRCPR